MNQCLCWLHIGDLHASAADDWTGPRRLERLFADLSALSPSAVDFIYLPGDNANEGEPEQYSQIRAALADRTIKAPLYVIPGDHDFVPGSLDAFRRFLEEVGAPPPPACLKLKGRRVLLLDVVSPGGGGPAFALGEAQTMWLQKALIEARADDDFSPIVLMHAFPADLAAGGAALAERFAEAGVALVDTGHTHYNEIINDGAVIYTAARSTAQIEEGGADAFGAAFAAVDGDQAAFKFRSVGSGWPFVMITSPADQRLQVRPPPLDCAGRLTVRAKVFGANGKARVTLHALGREIAMSPVDDESDLWSAVIPDPWRAALSALPPPQRLVPLTVRAETSDGVGEDVVQVGLKRRGPPSALPGARGGPIGAWVEHGVLGTKLGPNAFGSDW